MTEENILKIDLTGFNSKAVGYSEEFTLEETLKLEDIKFNSAVSGEFKLILNEEGVYVWVKEFHCEVIRECDKCLTESQEKVSFYDVSREFIFPEFYKKSPDKNEKFLIETRPLAIDISEMMRQEIILHFSETSVCSSSCQGFCEFCGVQNKSCDCSKESLEENYPLAKLKDLIQ